jgi:Cellulase (glycosyl hydrolase family 5)
MTISRRHALGLAAAAALPRRAAAQSLFVRAKGKELVRPNGEPLRLRGINLGNWFEPEGYMFLFDQGPQSPREIEDFVCELIGPAEATAFWSAYRRSYITPADIRFIHRRGFNSVRIPLHWKFFVADGAGFEVLDPIVEACRKDEIYVILDMHCAPGGQTGTNIDDSYGYPWLYESAKSQDQLADVWVRIAKRYRDQHAVLGYDLLNEPIPHFPRLRKYNPLLEPIYKKVTRAIREVDRNHVIVLGGAQWDTNFDVFHAPFDDNLLYQLHKYWMTPNLQSIQPYLAFRDRYNVPIWLGESGENTDAWIEQFRTLLEHNNVGWCFWPYKKLVKPSCVVSVKKPQGWDEIVKLGAMPPGTGNAEKRIAARPSVEACRAALRDLLANVPLAACDINRGYLQALGLETNPAGHA